MKKQCQHQWQITRELSELEKRVTHKEVEVRCRKCGQTGKVNYRDLKWLIKQEGVDMRRKQRKQLLDALLMIVMCVLSVLFLLCFKFISQIVGCTVIVVAMMYLMMKIK